MRVLLNSGYSANFTWDLHKEWGEKLTTRTLVNNLLESMNNLLIMNSLIDTMQDFVSLFFTMSLFYTSWNYQSNLWLSDVFREYKTGTLARNRSSFLTHFNLVFLFYAPLKRQKTLGLRFFQGGIKSKHWQEIGEIISYLS